MDDAGTGGDELVRIGRPEVELPAFDAILGHPTRCVRCHREEGIPDATIHLITTRADAGADGGHEVGWGHTEGLNRSDRGLRNRSAGTFPAGMHGGHNTMVAIGDENRHTVGDTDRDDAGGVCGDNRVGFDAWCGRNAREHVHHHPAVHLLHARDLRFLDIEQRGELCVVALGLTTKLQGPTGKHVARDRGKFGLLQDVSHGCRIPGPADRHVNHGCPPR